VRNQKQQKKKLNTVVNEILDALLEANRKETVKVSVEEQEAAAAAAKVDIASHLHTATKNSDEIHPIASEPAASSPLPKQEPDTASTDTYLAFSSQAQAPALKWSEIVAKLMVDTQPTMDAGWSGRAWPAGWPAASTGASQPPPTCQRQQSAGSHQEPVASQPE